MWQCQTEFESIGVEHCRIHLGQLIDHQLRPGDTREILDTGQQTLGEQVIGHLRRHVCVQQCLQQWTAVVDRIDDVLSSSCLIRAHESTQQLHATKQQWDAVLT